MDHLKEPVGLPHHVNLETTEGVAAFADAELGALVLHGSSGLDARLPSTDNQKARQQQLKKTGRKRAAAAKAPALPSQANVDSAEAAHFRTTATTSMWADSYTHWTTKGSGTKGISCLFAHAGFPVTEKRCLMCGLKNHISKK